MQGDQPGVVQASQRRQLALLLEADGGAVLTGRA